MTIALPQLSLPDSRVAALGLTHENYRPDVDGLRAVAILGVLGYHAAPRLMPGGFVGVDVFFVISGFLISSIILRGLGRGSFTILDFYARRVKRIFPALLTMLIGAWIMAWPLLLWDEYQALGKQLIASAGFALNLLLYADFNSYFGRTASTTPLLHLWSLGVEEQFYIVWPLLLAVLSKVANTHAQRSALVLAAAASFVANLVTVPTDPTAAFYLPYTRLWELALGSLLAHAEIRQQPSQGVKGATTHASALMAKLRLSSHECRGWTGAALIGASLCCLNGEMLFPGWWALIPCTGTLLLISAGPQSWINRATLGSRPLVYIGLISYPLYLWHWPLLSIIHIVEASPPSPVGAVAALGAAFVLAALTCRYIELPIRSHRNMRLVPVVLCALMAVCVGIGYLTFTRALPARSEGYDLDRFIRASREDWLTGGEAEWELFPRQFVTLGSGPRWAMFIGDSNMQQYYPRIRRVLAEHPPNARGAIFAVRAGCAPVVIEVVEESYLTDACRTFLHDALERAQDPEIDTIVIAAFWSMYVSREWTEAGPNELKQNAGSALDSLQSLLAGFVAGGKRAFLVLNMPTGPALDPRRMIHRTVLRPGFTVTITAPSRVDVLQAIGSTSSALRRVAARSGATIIDPLEYLCDETTCAAVTAEGEPMYRDFAHLRPSYVREMVHFLDATVIDPRPLTTLHASALSADAP